MESPAWMDLILGGVAIAVFAGGLLLLLNGVLSMNQKK